MSYEIELKAHVADYDVERIKNLFETRENSIKLGKVEKDDIYWGLDDDIAIFRTRREKNAEGYRILFTVKPSRSFSDEGVENNEEVEFEAFDHWEACLNFQKSLGYKIVRHKFKEGYHYQVNSNGFKIHVELLNVRFLGWFLEMEICPETLDSVDVDSAVKTLKDLVGEAGLESTAIEPKSYSSMLKTLGHQLG